MKYFQQFFSKNDVLNGLLLIISAITAMLLANIEATCDLYRAFLETPIEIKIGMLEFKKNVLLWINDALMTVFFLLVGLEIKHELTEGSLINRRQIMFSFIATIGGMVVPILIYLAFNFYDPIIRNGWAIPSVTDIAFSLGTMALLSNRVPLALKTFLMTLAIIDDLGAIMIIALFYTKELSLLSLEITIIAIAILLILNICNIRNIGIYILVGIILWIAVLKSGIHATLAGVIIGLLIPFKEKKKKILSPAKILEHILRPWVNFLVLPLFAFTNAGISLQNITMKTLNSSLLLGIIIALFIGKPLGISTFCWIAMKLKIASLPKGITCRQIIAVSMLCGIGFTMSIFIATLAFDSYKTDLVVLAKLGVLIGSLFSAIIGYSLLKAELFNQNHSYPVK